MKRHMTLFFCLLLAVVLTVGITVQADSVAVQVEDTHPLAGYTVYPVSYVKTSSQGYWNPATAVNGNTGDNEGWHTEENGGQTAYYTVDLGESKELSYFAALPRSPETEGSDYYGRFIKDFVLYVTENEPNGDYSNLGTPAVEASFAAMSQIQWQSVTFPAVTGRYVTVQVKSIAGDTDRDTCINVREFAFGGVDESGYDAEVNYDRETVTNHTPGASNLYEDKWGLFCHFLGYGYTAEEWNAAVNVFDVDDYAAKLNEMGAGYVILTIQQGSENICRPVPNILKKPGNETRNRLGIPTVGTDRDLPADLYVALEKYDIDLYLYQATDYYTVHDEDGEDLTFKVIDDYMREYTQKGVKIAGWYFDGVGDNTYRMQPLREAVSKWDPDCAITFNTGRYQNGNGEDFSQIEAYDLMSTAYSVELGVNGRLANGELGTVCTYLSQWYGQDGHDPSNPWLAPNLPGPRYTDEQLIEASKTYIQAGGTITYDVPVFYRTADNEEIDPDKTGSIGLLNKYVEQLKALGEALEEVSREETIAPPVRKMYNDNSTTMTYAGSWDYHSYNGQNNPDPYASAYFTDYADGNNPAGAQAGDFHRSNERGATMTFTFETGVSEQADLVLLGRTGVKMGKASVSVDGGEAVVIDTYAPSLYSQQKLFQVQDLQPGKHTVTVTVLGEKNDDATDCYVAIDAIAVYPTVAGGGEIVTRDPWVQDAKVGFMLHWGILSGTDAHVYEQNFKDYPAYARRVEEYTDENGYLRTRLPDWDARIQDIDVSVWVDEAKKIGADYITFAGFHSGLGYIRPWHSDVPGFPETERDILGELIEAAHAEGIRVVVYMTTSVNHAREDVYGYYRPDEYVKWAKANDSDTIDALYGAGTAASLTDAQWQVSFNPVDNSFGFGAFTFDEIEYLMNHYDIDGFWFDAHNNPTWYKADQYPWSTGFVYDGCNGYTDDEGQHACTDPEAHKGYAYSAESFAENYFYRRDIVGFVKSMDPGCATFENNFPPNLGTEILGQETYSHLGNPDYRIVTEGSPVSEGLYVTATTNTYVDWWMQGNENLTVYSQAELKRIVHTIAAGAISTIGQGPFNDRNTWPKYAADFNTFLSTFNQFAGKTYLADGLTTGYGQTGTYAYGEKNDGAFVMPVQDEANGIHYLHILTRPSGNTLVLESAVPFIQSVEAVTAGGAIPLSYTQSGGKLTITIPSWESYDQWGDYILAITENRNVGLEDVIAYLNDNYVAAIVNGKLELPSVEDAAVQVVNAQPAGAISADGTVAAAEETRMLSFRLQVTMGGQTAETKQFSVLDTDIGGTQTLVAATGSSDAAYDHDATFDKAIDGNTTTFWHSHYNGSGITLPQYLTVELAGKTMVGGIEYVPRQDVPNGYITAYEIQVSTDGTSFTTVATGTWAEDTTTKTVTFSAQEAKYVKLVAIKGVGGNQFVSCAELRVLGGGTVTEAAPAAISVGGTAALPAVTGTGTWTIMNPAIASVDNGQVTGLAKGETWAVWESADGTQVVVVSVQVKTHLPALSLKFSVSETDQTAGVLTAVFSGADSNGGKESVFTVDGSVQTALTDADGIAVLEVQNLSHTGSHTFGASFAGDAENAAVKAENVTYTLSSQFRSLCDFEDADDADFFVDYSNKEDDKPGKCEIVTGDAAISGQKSLRVYNEAGTFWSNGTATKETVSTAGISGFAFRLKAAAGVAVKPMLQIDTLNKVNADLRSGFLVFDKDGNQMTSGYSFDAAWGNIRFSADFEGYLFLPYSETCFDDLDNVQNDAVHFAFHFEYLPVSAPEYVVDDFGVYQGEDYAALIEQMNGAETPCTHPETEMRGRVEPTCTAPGYTGDTHCAACGKLLEQGAALEALGHSAGTAWEKNENRHYHVCTRCGETLDETAHTGVLEGYVAPTRWETGYSGDTVCEVCGYLMEEGRTLPKLPGGGAHVMPEEPEEEPTLAAEAEFADVRSSDWYAEAVSYVAEAGIMTGVAEGEFAPDGAVTRAMVWTVLARLDGINTEGGGSWYARAQSWAMETGVSDGTDPMGSITREQLAAMLYRSAGSPAVGGSLSAYPDAASVSDWAVDAMLWATETGLINGMGGNLSPQTGATRAQLAALLMRWLEN